MKAVVAALIKKKTSNGYFEVLETVPLGKLYNVDLHTIRMYKCKNLPTGKIFRQEMIYDVDDMNYLPTELLEFQRYWMKNKERLQKERHKLQALEEVSSEWQNFAAAVQKPKPAIEIFTKKALMFMYLAFGNKALK